MKERKQSPPSFLPSDPIRSPVSQDNITDPLPSPPYRTFASTSQVVLASTPSQESPAYRSQADLTPDDPMTDTFQANERDAQDADVDRPAEEDVKPQPKPTVHYPDTVPAPHYETSPPRINVDSRTGSQSGPPSVTGTDDDDDQHEDDYYDWSGEDDILDNEAKFERQMGYKQKDKTWGFRRIITLLFSSLIGSTFLAGMLVTPGILIHYFWYKDHPTEHRRFVEYNVQAWLFWAAVNLPISWGLAMIVDIVPIVVKIFLSAAWGHVSEGVKSRIELYDSVKDTIKPVLYAASAWASWVILFDDIYHLYDSGRPDTSWASYTSRTAQAVEFVFFLALAICVQRMLSHAIAFGFHRAAYQERIDKLKDGLRVIEVLRNFRPKSKSYGHHRSPGSRTPVLAALGFGHSPHVDKEQYASATSRHETLALDSGDEALEEKHVHIKRKGASKVPNRQQTTTTVSTMAKTPMLESSSRPLTPSGLNPIPRHYLHSSSADSGRRRSLEGSFTEEPDATLVQAAKALKAAVLHDARNVQGKNTEVSGLLWNVNTAHEAKRLARAIYMRFKDDHRTYLTPSDFYVAFPTKEEAEKAFRVFDVDNNGDISRTEIKTTLLRVYKERRILSRSMRDVGVALKTLDHILLFFAFVILFFIGLSVFAVSITKSLTSVYTIGIAASFVFKNAASNAFDAVMFLFVSHPFDTGDRIFINDENLVVKKMGLFATVFQRVDGTETYYFNSQLFVQFITNVRRSGKMYENCSLKIAWRTPLEKVDALEKCLNEWLATEENRWFEPNTSITLQNIENQCYLELTIGIGHNGTWQDWGLRCQRKTAFHAAVNYYCRQLGITCYDVPMPIMYADPETQSIMPSTPTSEGQDNDGTPPSPSIRSSGDNQAELDLEQPKMKAAMGFSPKPSAVLTRARKSKDSKGALRATGADGS